jgi:hypothetical protein
MQARGASGGGGGGGAIGSSPAGISGMGGGMGGGGMGGGMGHLPAVLPSDEPSLDAAGLTPKQRMQQRKQREAAAKRDPLLQYQLTKPLLCAEDIKQRLEVGAQPLHAARA